MPEEPFISYGFLRVYGFSNSFNLNKAVGTSRRVCEGENENRTISPKNKGVINIPPVQLPHLG